MLLASKEKTMRLSSLTEKDTPFRETTASKLFKNTANLSLRGNTYDARHLDRFLQSSYGEKSTQLYNNSSLTLSQDN